MSNKSVRFCYSVQLSSLQLAVVKGRHFGTSQPNAGGKMRGPKPDSGIRSSDARSNRSGIYSPPARQLGLPSFPVSQQIDPVGKGTTAAAASSPRGGRIRGHFAKVAGPEAVRISNRVAQMAKSLVSAAVERATSAIQKNSTSSSSSGRTKNTSPPITRRRLPDAQMHEVVTVDCEPEVVSEGSNTLRPVDETTEIVGRRSNKSLPPPVAAALSRYLQEIPTAAALIKDGKDVVAGMTAFVKRAAREAKSTVSVTVEQPKPLPPFSPLVARSLERESRVRQLNDDLLDSPVEVARKRLSEQRPLIKRPDRMLVNWISKVSDKPSKKYLARVEKLKVSRASAEQKTLDILPSTERSLTLTSFSDNKGSSNTLERSSGGHFLPPAIDSLSARPYGLVASEPRSGGVIFSETERKLNCRHSPAMQRVVSRILEDPSVPAELKQSVNVACSEAKTRFSIPSRVRAHHLPFGIREKDLEVAFKQFSLAPIKHPVSLVNDGRGRFTGQAHIYFATDAEAKRAVTKMRHRWYGTRYWSLSLDSGNPSRPRNSRPLLSINGRQYLPIHQSRVL